jgi:putative peptide zinc metalloprotease protein
LPDGLARDAAFVTLFLTGVSTVLFNANPLQRLDGYYIASDLLDLPNLAPRSRQWWLARLQARWLGGQATEPMALARGEGPWLAAYAPLSWAYGLLVATLAVLWLGSVSALLGTAAGLLLGWQLGIKPAWGLLTSLRQHALGQPQSSRRWQHLRLAGAAGLVLLALLPLPQRSLVQGVVWPPEQAQLRADEAGFVQRQHEADGQWLQPGTLVAELANPGLQTRWQAQQARVDALEAELNAALPGQADAGADRQGPMAGDASAELAQAEAELARLQQRLASLAVRAQVAGRLALPQPDDLAGRYLQRGQLLGQVVANAPPTVRVALPESLAQSLRQASRSVSVRLAASPGQAHDAKLLGDAGGAQHQLPSAALSQRRGGPVATDPQDPDDLRALNPVLQIDLQLSQPPQPAARLGERAWVRFDTGWAPLGWQLLQGLQRGLLARLNPQF